MEKVTLMGGLRYEYTGNTNRGGRAEVTADYDHLIPNVSLNWVLGSGLSLNLNYTKTIRRPNISYLNPFVDELNPTLQVAGNPDLKPMAINNFDLQFRRIKKGALIVNLRYAQTRNTIQQLFIDTDEVGISRFQMANAGRKRDIGAYLSYNRMLGQKVSVSLSGTLTHVSVTGTVSEETVSRSGYTGDVAAAVNYVPKAGFSLGARYSYNAPTVLLQGKANSMPYVVLNGSKNFFNDKLSLGVMVANPFTRYFNNRTEYGGAAYFQKVVQQSFSRQFQVSLTYRFGQLKEFTRENRKTIQNADDIGNR